jgi:hypothetical protein
LQDCEVYQGNQIISNLNSEKKLELFLIARFMKNSSGLISDEIDKYKSDNLERQKFTIYLQRFIEANEEFNISEEKVNELFINYFDLLEDTFSLTKFFEFYMNKYYFKIKVIDFIDITLERIIALYNYLEFHLIKIFDEFDFKKAEFIETKEFQKAIMNVIGGGEREWKIGDFFE